MDQAERFPYWQNHKGGKKERKRMMSLGLRSRVVLHLQDMGVLFIEERLGPLIRSWNISKLAVQLPTFLAKISARKQYFRRRSNSA